MYFFVAAFLLGDVSVQHLTKLPRLDVLFLTLIVMFILFFTIKKIRNNVFYFLFAYIVGILWTTWYAQTILAWQLPHYLEKQTVSITGTIASIPINIHHQSSFIFSLKTIKYENKIIESNINTLLKLSVHQNNKDDYDQFHVGDEWQFHARLKRIHGTLNPGEFDYEAWALQRGLRASGYIVGKAQHHQLGHYWYRYPILQLREHIQSNVEKILPDMPQAPWLIALIVGERGNVNQADWRVLRNTGTNHLMAIGGLHVGFIAGFIFTLVYQIWRFIPRICLYLPAQEAAAFASLLTAIVYSVFAGLSIPTQRALIMLSAFIVTLLSRRKVNPWSSWALAILMVLFVNPLTVLTDSFWLSFITLALIIYGMHGRLKTDGLWWKLGRVQWVVGIGLIPITLTLFHEFSLVGFLANCVAIPWLGFSILPFCLFSTITLFIAPKTAALSLWLAGKSLTGLWWLLTWFANLHFSSWQQAMPNNGVLILTIIGVILLISPKGFPGKWLCSIFFLPLLFYQPECPKYGDFWLTLLDVGQGLSLVVKTKAHTLVYDTGARFNETFDMGESVVLPFLLTRAIRKIDMLVISHPDNDHIGGADALLKSLPITTIKTSDPGKIKTKVTELCQAGYQWQWDGVHFSFLYPFADVLGLRNNSSCVLRIDNGTHSVLLTGDIEKFAEKQLLKRLRRDQLTAEILIAPHHGSKTSGLKNFITTVNPKYVLYGVGYLNRYKFPHQSVMDTYNAINALQYDTAKSGAIEFKLEKSKAITKPTQYRSVHSRYWQ